MINNRVVEFFDWRAELDKYPNICPICHKAVSIEPYYNEINVVNNNNEAKKINDSYTVQVVFRCPACFKLFISTYFYTRNQVTINFRYSEPLISEIILFEKEIENLSPDFANIFRQASIAEVKKLNDISGCGYRKALEFLVKNYCIKFLMKEKDSINNKFLANCINEDLDDDEIKNASKRAVWLGNDEAHYYRKWNEYDITHLKELIRITQSLISKKIILKKFNDNIN